MASLDTHVSILTNAKLVIMTVTRMLIAKIPTVALNVHANGFMGNGMSCVDINECTNGAAKCGKNTRCLNTRGDYDCESVTFK